MTETLVRAVLRRYRERRAAGELDYPAFEAAVALYLDLAPGVTRGEASVAVGRIVNGKGQAASAGRSGPPTVGEERW